MGYLRYVILCLAVVLTVACRRSGAVEDPLLVKAPSVEDVDELCRPLVDGDYGKYVSGMLSASDKSEMSCAFVDSDGSGSSFTSAGTSRSYFAIAARQ